MLKIKLNMRENIFGRIAALAIAMGAAFNIDRNKTLTLLLPRGKRT